MFVHAQCMCDMPGISVVYSMCAYTKLSHSFETSSSTCSQVGVGCIRKHDNIALLTVTIWLVSMLYASV